MYTVRKQFSFSASHQLHLPYDSPCNRLHGHNYLVELCLASHGTNDLGMVVDYNDMKPFGEYIDTHLDHHHLNEVLPGVHTTAENLAKHLYEVAWSYWHDVQITVRVSETPKTWATYEQ
jgi:6-pyruvoyltetrahydropterin/6-carboxytetrahydropterin synthase